MPIIRNPFKRQDENVRPTTATSELSNASITKPISIAEKEPVEYKLSEINDSGVYLPPSPPERKSFWSTTSSRSTTKSNTNHRSVFNENEQFNISRESFDSYRRSFDITARSPILQPNESRPRISLDSRLFDRPPRSSLDVRGPPPPRTSNSFVRPSQVPAETVEDAFEDVDIASEEPKPQPAKKRGLFARMVDSNTESAERTIGSDGKSGSSWHHFGGRKRGQSGQGSELGAIKSPAAAGVESSSNLKREIVGDGDDETKPVEEPSAPAMQELSLGAAAQPQNREEIKPAMKGAKSTEAPKTSDSQSRPSIEVTHPPPEKVKDEVKV